MLKYGEVRLWKIMRSVELQPVFQGKTQQKKKGLISRILQCRSIALIKEEGKDDLIMEEGIFEEFKKKKHHTPYMN